MQHNPERLYDAINASELGAIITEHRNLLLCSLLRPMLETFEQEGIQLSAVLRALATLSHERSGSLSAAEKSNPWLQCESLLREAQAIAAIAEQRPKVIPGNGGSDRNPVLDYLSQAGQSQEMRDPTAEMTQPDPQGRAIAPLDDGDDIDADLEGLDISRITANLDLSKLGESLDGEFDAALEADLAAARGADSMSFDDLPETANHHNGNNSRNGDSLANAIASRAEGTSVDWSQISEDEAWARDLLEEN